MNVPGARREAAGGRDPDDDRDLGLEERPDDVVRRGQVAARRVELDHDRRRALALGPVDPFAEVLGHALVDDPGRRQDDHLLVARGQRRRGQHQHAQPERQTRDETRDVTAHEV